MELKIQMAAICFCVVTFILFWLTDNAQKRPYMDEVFHVPQVQQYCASNFSAWDPMITTLPGLYFATLFLLYPVALVFGHGDILTICTTSILRSTNILFSVGNCYVLYLIAHRLHFNRKNTSEVVLTALALGTFPVLYFFTFLYYTDPAAIFFALLTYLLALSHRQLLSAAVGAFAIVCRQTNVVWVVFVAGLAVGQILLEWLQLDKKQGKRTDKNFSDWLILSKTVSLIGHSIQHNPKQLMRLVVDVVSVVWSYGVVAVAFVAFVFINEGIVVGDRSNHQSCLNFPQLFYFLFITTFFSFMHMISVKQIKEFIKTALTKPFKTCLFLVTAILLVYKFMYIHEYNLADNRHYNFYFLSKLVKRSEYAKYMLIPAYYYGFVTFWNLMQNKDVFWRLCYVICTAASIVPQRMIEFRYFIMPYLIFRLNMPMPSKMFLIAEVLFYMAINAFTVFMYVYKPFPWSNTDSLQRFMW